MVWRSLLERGLLQAPKLGFGAAREDLLGEEPMKKLNLRHILCPIDFSPLPSASLAAGSAFARARDAELRALHVMPSEGAAVPAGLGSLERQELMSRLRASLDEAAPSYDLVGAAVRQGDPATEILRFARAMPADSIVMGAPGADRPERPMGRVTSVWLRVRSVLSSQCPPLTRFGRTSPDSSGESSAPSTLRLRPRASFIKRYRWHGRRKGN